MYEEGFFGVEARKIDDKGRIILPKSFSANPKDKLLFIRKEDYLEICSKSVVEKKLKELKLLASSANSVEILKFYERKIDELFFEVEDMVQVDSQNRILLGKRFLGEYPNGTNIVLVGAYDCIRVYTEEKYNQVKSNRKK